MTTYDDGAPQPNYKWDENFTVVEFETHIYHSSFSTISNWIETDFGGRLSPHGVSLDGDGDELEAFKHMVCGPTVDAVLNRKNDILLQVLLPCDFAIYANDLVSRALAQAGLPETKILTPAVRGFNFLANRHPHADGLFFWRIGKDLMWQQFDRRVDEVFEMLYAFRRVNEQLRDTDTFQELRFREELARREVYDEFDAFARWVQA